MANTGDNYGAVLEALNEKMDRDIENRHSGVETVVEHWHEGTEWYRVWSDGWIEQGGEVTSPTNASQNITLHKPFSNTNFFAIPTRVITYNGSNSQSYLVSKTTTTITIAGFSPKNLWYACGY